MNLTLEKGLKVLECLAGRAAPMSVGAIAKEINAPSPTVYRMLETLKAHGYVEQEHNRGDYSAGLRVLSLSAEILNRMELRRKAGPYMHDLTEKTGCSAYLGAASNGRSVMIMTYHPGGRVHAALGEIGSVSSCQYTAMGKLIAAYLPDKDLSALLKATPMEKRTSTTITSRARLKKELVQIREAGLGRTAYENSDDIHGIAVPIRNFEGTVIAALGLAVPRRTEEKEGMDRFEDALREAGEKLSYAVGYAASSLV